MLFNIISQINWLDLVIIVIIFRVCYIAIEAGVFVELFKILGTLAAIYFSLHYYTSLGFSIQNTLGLKNISLQFFNFISALVISIFSYFVFVILRKVALRAGKTESIPLFSKWGGIILGITRSFLLASLILFMLAICGNSYLKESVKYSYTGSRIFKVAPDTYSLLWEGLFSKFAPTERLNKSVTEVQKSIK